MKPKLLYILKGYPRFSETFIAQEIHLLEQLGFDIHIVSLRKPDPKQRHPVHDQIKADILYLPEYLYQEPMRVLIAFASIWRFKNRWQLFKKWFKAFRYSSVPNHFRRLGQAFVLANELPEQIEHIHVHFLHTPATVGWLTSMLKDMKWTCSAHAKDIWTITAQEKIDKLNDMQWLTTCTETGQKHLQSLIQQPEKINLDYHGIEFENFSEDQQGSSSDKETKILLSVGRAVEKKGYTYLLKALSNLKNDPEWEFHHIGGGDQLELLQTLAKEYGIDDRITWHGAKPQPYVLDYYRKADLFVLPCITLDNGDRDGIPNVLVEAMSQKLCCVSSDLASVQELITHEENGLTVRQRDADHLAEALTHILKDNELRKSLGEKGFQTVKQKFNCQKCIEDLADRFEAL